jgi:hypothetical protein
MGGAGRLSPAQSHDEWDLLEVTDTIPGGEAFRPLQEGDARW